MFNFDCRKWGNNDILHGRELIFISYCINHNLKQGWILHLLIQGSNNQPFTFFLQGLNDKQRNKIKLHHISDSLWNVQSEYATIFTKAWHISDQVPWQMFVNIGFSRIVRLLIEFSFENKETRNSKHFSIKIVKITVFYRLTFHSWPWHHPRLKLTINCSRYSIKFTWEYDYESKGC